MTCLSADAGFILGSRERRRVMRTFHEGDRVAERLPEWAQLGCTCSDGVGTVVALDLAEGEVLVLFGDHQSWKLCDGLELIV